MTLNLFSTEVENEKEALALMIHHLELAADYFEGTPDPIDTKQIKPTFSLIPMIKWVEEMNKLYPN